MYEERRTVRFYNPHRNIDFTFDGYEINANPIGCVWNKKTGKILRGCIRKGNKYFNIKGNIMSITILLVSTFPEIYRPSEKDGEIWKPLKYNGKSWSDDLVSYVLKCYEVSNFGHIRSVCTGMILKGDVKDGYFRHVFHYKGKTIIIRDNIAVATTFLDNPSNLPIVNHKDGNKQNNHINNLEFCDNRDNIRHAIKTGLKKTPYSGYKIKCIETGVIFNYMADAITYYKIDRKTLGMCLKHTSKIEKGYICHYRSAGRHPVTGEKLHWVLVDEVGNEYTPEEFVKMKEREAATTEIDTEREV